MPDLNEWKLTAAGQSDFLFGSIGTSDYPLGVQVEIGDLDSDIQDQRHPTSDGVVMGKDTFGGFELVYNLKTLPNTTSPKWTEALDLLSTFKSRWRADGVRKTPGAYATLTNLERGRLVYGRPRKCSQKLQRLRKGLVEYIATFETNGPDWYSATETSVVIPVVAPSTNGVKVPIKTPVTTANAVAPAYNTVTNAGDVNSWGIFDIKGPASGIAVSLITPAAAPVQSTLWRITLPTALKAGQTVRVDTRPWARSAILLPSTPANGRLRGSQLENCFIPPGPWRVRFDAIDPTGVASVTFKYRSAYASL